VLVVEWLAGWLDGWLAGWLVEWLDGWMVGWLAGWMDGWLDGWVIGWGWMCHASRTQDANVINLSFGQDPMLDVEMVLAPPGYVSRTPTGIEDEGFNYRGSYNPQTMAGLSYYYIAPKMPFKGKARFNGTEVNLRGNVWFEHQWGNIKLGNGEQENCRWYVRVECMCMCVYACWIVFESIRSASVPPSIASASKPRNQSLTRPLLSSIGVGPFHRPQANQCQPLIPSTSPPSQSRIINIR
jgi:hypothetical protein